VIVRKLEQRFGVVGFGRLIKVLELVGEVSLSVADEPCVIAWADVLEGLQADDMKAWEFLTYCEKAGALCVTRDEGRLQVTLCGELAALMANAPAALVMPGPVLFESDEQWAEWFTADLNCPPHLASDAQTRRLYLRWCATNVTVAEIEAAIELAVGDGRAPLPAVLHEYLKTVRNNKIERARR
jgi:hypothetical protein